MFGSSGNREEHRDVTLWITADVLSSVESELTLEADEYRKLGIAVGVIGIELSAEVSAVRLSFFTGAHIYTYIRLFS